MVIKTDEDLEVGKVYGNETGTSLTDINSVEHERVAFLVLKKVTVEEYISYVISEGLDNFLVDRRNFYEVTMD